jgi:thymidylate synthase
MKLSTIEARDIPEAWFLVLRAILNDGYVYKIERGSFEGARRQELDFVTIRIQNPGLRPLVPLVPAGVPAPTSDSFLDDYIPYLMADSKKKDEAYTYGTYLASQIPKVIDMLRKDGFDTNQACMTVGDQNSIDLIDPPCLKLIDCRVRYGALHFIVYFRSWDAYSGFPTNIGGLQLVKEYMSSELNVNDGELIACSKGLHLYDFQWDVARQACGIA